MVVEAYRHGIQLDFIRPRKPIENGFIESFNRRLRVEFLNLEVSFTLEDVREKLSRWQQDYNLIRPHSALGDHGPVPLEAQGRETPAARTERAQAKSSDVVWPRFAGQVTSCATVTSGG